MIMLYCRNANRVFFCGQQKFRTVLLRLGGKFFHLLNRITVMVGKMFRMNQFCSEILKERFKTPGVGNAGKSGDLFPFQEIQFFAQIWRIYTGQILGHVATFDNLSPRVVFADKTAQMFVAMTAG